MPDDLPVPSGDSPLPTLSDWIASWLGFQLPSIPMPQTVKNLDKAVGKILLAAGENAEVRIKSNTGKAKAKGKIDVEGMYRTEDEKRKLENRAASVKVATDEISEKPNRQDADQDIDDDWLNLYAKIAEDKSSEELQSLFGKILAGEIQRPGTFSLRTLQFLSTLSRADAQTISSFFAYAISDLFVPMAQNLEHGPHIHSRILMEELGLASQPNMIGGLVWNIDVPSNRNLILTSNTLGILIANRTTREIKFPLECQVLTMPAKELIKIANPPASDFEYLKEVSQIIFEKIRAAGFAEEIVNTGTVSVQAGDLIQSGPQQYTVVSRYQASMPGQTAS
jgi:hypothetical protein